MSGSPGVLGTWVSAGTKITEPTPSLVSARTETLDSEPSSLTVASTPVGVGSTAASQPGSAGIGRGER